MLVVVVVPMSFLSRKFQLSRAYSASVSAAVLLSLIAPLPALAQEQILRTLTVTGQGVESIQTTLATVRLGVEVQGPSAETVQAEVARRSNAVVKFLKSQQVDKLQTTGINLNPRYKYTDGNQQLVGYQGRNTVSFQTAIEKSGGIIDKAVKTGASRVDGISFKATEDAIKAAQKVALKTATQEAQEQAKAVLDPLGFTPKEIVGIQVNGATAQPPRPVFARGAVAEASSAPQPIIGGEQKVRSFVTLQIRY